MSDKYFNEAQRKVLIVDDEAQALKPADSRLSDDPLTALAAVMRHHKMEFVINTTGGCQPVPQFSIDCEAEYGDLFSIDGFLTLTADDIKPEQ